MRAVTNDQDAMAVTAFASLMPADARAYLVHTL